ncbi:MAG TPA: hypothetical protein VNL69_00825 [Bacteroidota bacterium]|nr:hypothetical protein [Bacteroidota bacterium]
MTPIRSVSTCRAAVRLVAAAIAAIGFPLESLAQGYGAPLTMQGLDRTTMHSSASRALGGTTLGLTADVSLMFANPSLLSQLQGIQAWVGSARYSSSAQQVQHYAPLKYYSNFSLLMEGLTGYIPDPDTSLPGINAGDTVQRPYDTLGPNWARSRSRTLPVQVMLGVPFAIGDIRLAVAAGVVEYADMNDYYQNNNVLTPSILSNRPLPTPRPPNDSIPTIVRWWQNIRSREGYLRGYGGAVAASLSDQFSFGVSGMLVRGTTDDFEQQLSRGRMTFFTNFFRLDSVYGKITHVGTSDFTGAELSLAATYRTRTLAVGFVAKPPATFTREFSLRQIVDTSGTAAANVITGKDKIRLPWRGTLGLAIIPEQHLMLGIEYEIRSFVSAVYTDATGLRSNPWRSATVFHFGAQYTPADWLTVRIGLRDQAEVFEPEGNPLVGEPVVSTVYAAGIGFRFSGLRLNVTYEFVKLKYEDVWGSAVSFNSDRRHTISADVAYELPSLW